MLTCLYFFLLFLLFFDFDLDYYEIVFILSFSGCYYYAVSSVSVSAATRLAYDTYFEVFILIRTYADLTFLFLSEVYDLFQLVIIVCIILCFYLFSSSGGNFPIQSYWSLSCDHGLHACIVAMS